MALKTGRISRLNNRRRNQVGPLTWNGKIKRSADYDKGYRQGWLMGYRRGLVACNLDKFIEAVKKV